MKVRSSECYHGYHEDSGGASHGRRKKVQLEYSKMAVVEKSQVVLVELTALVQIRRDRRAHEHDLECWARRE